MFTTVQDLEKHILTEPLLKFNGLNKIPDDITTVRQFLDLFFTYLNKNYNTVYLDNSHQTNKNCLRSLGDIFRITKHYLPNATLNEILKTLKGYHDDGKLYSHYCSVIGKRIYTICSYSPIFHNVGANGDANYYLDELGYDDEYDDEYDVSDSFNFPNDEFGCNGEEIFNFIQNEDNITISEIIVEEPILNPVYTINNKVVSREKCKRINGKYYEQYVDVFPGYSPKRKSTWFLLDTINNNKDIIKFDSIANRIAYINK
jgi:hypothetical protein